MYQCQPELVRHTSHLLHVQYNLADHYKEECQWSERIRKWILYRGCNQNSWTNFTVEFPTPKQWQKKLYQYMPQTLLRYNPHVRPTSNLNIFICVDVYKSPRIQVLMKMKRRFINALFMTFEPFATAAGPWKVCGLPWSDGSFRTPIKTEDIWRICSELWLTEQQEHNSCLIWNKYFKCIMSVSNRMHTVKLFIVKFIISIKMCI